MTRRDQAQDWTRVAPIGELVRTEDMTQMYEGAGEGSNSMGVDLRCLNF
jgi:hypothetical protein